MQIKLVAIDLDGTLTVDADPIPQRTQDAIADALAAGVIVVLATGRAYNVAAKTAAALNLSGPVIAYQGGLVQDYHTDQILLAEYMPLDISRRVIKFARAKKLPLVMYMPGGIYTELPTDLMLERFQAHGTSLAIAHNLLTLLDETEQPIKFLTVQPPERNDEIFELIEAEFNETLTVIRSSEVYVEAYWPTISKGRALQMLAEQYQIPLIQTMAIGDHDNDISMLRMAGLGIAMGNGSTQVKAVADVIAPSVQEVGVAWAIEKYVLGFDA